MVTHGSALFIVDRGRENIMVIITILDQGKEIGNCTSASELISTWSTEAKRNCRIQEGLYAGRLQRGQDQEHKCQNSRKLLFVHLCAGEFHLPSLPNGFLPRTGNRKHGCSWVPRVWLHLISLHKSFAPDTMGTILVPNVPQDLPNDLATFELSHYDKHFFTFCPWVIDLYSLGKKKKLMQVLSQTAGSWIKCPSFDALSTLYVTLASPLSHNRDISCFLKSVSSSDYKLFQGRDYPSLIQNYNPDL